MGVRKSVVREVPRDLQCLTRIWAICVVVDISILLDHSDLGILSNLGASSNFTSVQADAASAVCPSQIW